MTNEDLTLREAAARARAAPETVRGWITDLPPHRRLLATQIGPQRRYLIRLVDLETFLDRR